VVLRRTRHTTRHFGDEFFHAVDCTDTDNLQQVNKITRAHDTQKNQTQKNLPWLR